jgi:hypothetical protein
MIGCVCSFLTTVHEFGRDVAMALVRFCCHNYFIETNRTVAVDSLASRAQLITQQSFGMKEFHPD